MPQTLLKIFLISMTPIGELRVGIPYGIYNDIDAVLTFVVAVAGNMIPVFVLLWLLPKIDNYIGIKASAFYKCEKKNDVNAQINFFKRLKPKFLFLYNWYRHRTEKKYSKRFKKLGALALITFVAIPLPVTGAWTGTLAAIIFRIPPKRALPLIFIGVLIAGVIMSLISLGILKFDIL